MLWASCVAWEISPLVFLTGLSLPLSVPVDSKNSNASGVASHPEEKTEDGKVLREEDSLRWSPGSTWELGNPEEPELDASWSTQMVSELPPTPHFICLLLFVSPLPIVVP